MALLCQKTIGHHVSKHLNLFWKLVRQECKLKSRMERCTADCSDCRKSIRTFNKCFCDYKKHRLRIIFRLFNDVLKEEEGRGKGGVEANNTVMAVTHNLPNA